MRRTARRFNPFEWPRYSLDTSEGFFTMDPTPFFLIHSAIAGLVTYVFSFYSHSKARTIWNGCMTAVLLTFLWPWAGGELFMAWLDLFIEVPGKLLFGRLLSLRFPDGEDLIGLIGGWVVPFAVSWGVVWVRFRKGPPKQRVGVKEHVIFWIVFALILIYWARCFDLEPLESWEPIGT